MTDRPVLLITGTRTGIGRGLAEYYVGRGFQVVGCSRRACDLRLDGYVHHELDVSDEARVVGMFADVRRRFGRLDVLINNASSFFPTAVGDITERAWDDLVGTNLKAPLFLSQAAAPQLRQHRGAIVNIVDIHADRPMKDYVVYSTAKGGLVALTRSLARELGPEVRVNGVAPGAIVWPEDAAWSNEAERERIIAQTSLQRVGEPDDIARAVRFLVADAPYVTGQILAVDGGRSISL
jgi:pteridine reductase